MAEAFKYVFKGEPVVSSNRCNRPSVVFHSRQDQKRDFSSNPFSGSSSCKTIPQTWVCLPVVGIILPIKSLNNRLRGYLRNPSQIYWFERIG